MGHPVYVLDLMIRIDTELIYILLDGILVSCKTQLFEKNRLMLFDVSVGNNKSHFHHDAKYLLGQLDRIFH